jgi:hypothetical protein
MRHRLLTATLLLACPALAQVDPKIHKLCIEAKDYVGCVKAMSATSLRSVQKSPEINSQPDANKLDIIARTYASHLCKDGQGFSLMTTEEKQKMAAKNSGVDYGFVASEAYFDKPEIANVMTKIATKECPSQLSGYYRKEIENYGEGLGKAGLRQWFGPGQDKNAPTERPADGATVAIW